MHDFYSDTKALPSKAMLEFGISCPVGDEQKNEDPTTLDLCARVATLLGKEAAVYLPSGTMCNQIAISLHTSPGDEVICEESAHIIHYEGGGPAAMSGVMIHGIRGDHGLFKAADVTGAIRPASRYMPQSRLLCVEQTSNLGGGTVWPLDQLNDVALRARAAGLATHMDGARLMNACVRSGIVAADYTRNYDSCWIDFTKGLGAPVGAVLAGSQEFIDRAWRVKQRIGGAMRQSGVIAAHCIYALENNVERLAKDHSLAAKIAAELTKIPGIQLAGQVETNIIIADLGGDMPTADSLVQRLRSDGVLVGAFGPRRIRIVTHLDVDEKSAEALLACLANHLSKGGIKAAQ